MEIEGYYFPDDIYYHKEHYWAKVEGNKVTMGTSDFAQKLAGQVVYVELPSIGRSLEASNQDLEETPELINESPYEKGWICKISPSNLQADLNNLMKGDSLKDFIKSEIERVKKMNK